MTTVSPTDNGGRGHRPPDPQGGRNSVTEPSQMPAHEDQQPTNMGGVWCGPHEEIATPQELPTRRPALVTTPSDARGGRRTTGADEGTGAQPASPDAAQTANYRTGTPTSSYASVVRRGQEQQETGLAPVPTTIAGKWSPRHKQLLLETLACDWISPSTPVDTPAQANMRRVAMEPSKVHANTALRARTQMEAETLLAYLNETLELPHPPNFIKATLPVLQRAIIEQYHGIHLETPLTADVDPRARLRKSMTHNTILGMLYAANGDTARGRQMISRLMEDVKRLHFDGIHTLTFVFNSERVAHLYKGLAFRLNGACLELEDTSEDQEIGTYRHASLRRQYAVRIYGAEDLGLVVLLAALSQLPGVQVVDAERPRTESTDIIDNRFFLLRFPDEHCPDQLRGVTKIQLHGQLVTVHHHVVHQRLPCARCYAPYHTTGYCKANPAHLDATRAKFKRTYSGQLPEYDVGKAVLYHHSDGESLSNFLTRLQQEVTQAMVPSDGTPETSTRVELVATVPSPAAGVQLAETSRSAPNGATPGPKAGGGPNAGLLPDTDVFKTVMRRPQKPQTDAQTGGHIQPGTQQRSATGASTNDNQTRATTTDLATGGRDKRPPTRFQPTNQRQNGQRRAPGKGKGKATAKKAAKPPAFEKFKRDLAIGKYNLLDNGDSDDNAEDSEQEPDEAPYAYDPAPFTPYEAGDGRVDTSQAPTANATGRVEEDSAIVDTEMTDGSQTAENPTGDNTEDDIMASAPESLLSSYIGSSPPSSPRSPAPTPGSEFPYSLASTMDEDNQFVPETDGSQEEATQSPGGVPQAKHEELAQPTGPSMSQDGFTIEQVAPAPGMPQQLPVFLMPFNGTLAEVPSNGQCAYTALYATMTSTYETELKFTKDVVQGANVLKRSVYTLMLANLANDVDCNVVDPCRELRRLYPSQPPPTDKAVAAAMLYDHYKQERARTVGVLGRPRNTAGDGAIPKRALVRAGE
ncbi:hypothetical protein PR003_g27303 [Phytophthora rubi]|uniref:OTU domain-containing protein n=1 Tax=Phytophthora rubi TaxID=129364 RepID=A0A6A4C2V4_9STRA|nr:hypothetical protein PR003_g27303 [Phytophthora rubi]